MIRERCGSERAPVVTDLATSAADLRVGTEHETQRVLKASAGKIITGGAGQPSRLLLKGIRCGSCVVYEDSEVVLLRGRFPLASMLGGNGGQDTIAVVSLSRLQSSFHAPSIPGFRDVGRLRFDDPPICACYRS